MGSSLLQGEDMRDGLRQPVPVLGFLAESFPAEPRERVEFGSAIVLGLAPLRADPAPLLELVQRRIQRSVADLKHVARKHLEPPTDRPAVHRLESEHLQNQQIERSLDEIRRLTHTRFTSVTEADDTAPSARYARRTAGRL